MIAPNRAGGIVGRKKKGENVALQRVPNRGGGGRDQQRGGGAALFGKKKVGLSESTIYFPDYILKNAKSTQGKSLKGGVPAKWRKAACDTQGKAGHCPYQRER